MLKHANVTLQVLKNNHLSWTPPRALAHKILPSRSLNKSKAALLKSRVEILLTCPAPFSRDPDSTIPWSLQLRLLLTFTSHMSVGMNSSRSASPCQLLDHLGQEFVISAYQKPPRLLVPCWFVPPAGHQVVKVSHEDQGLRIQGSFELFEGGLIFFPIRWVIADNHNSISHTGLPANPDP